MFIKAWTIAWRNVLRHRRRSVATLAAMILGIGIVISVRGLMNSTQQAERDSVILGRYGALQIFAKGYRSGMKARPLAKTIDDSADLRSKIMSVQGVRGVAPRLNFVGAFRGETGKLHYSSVIALDPISEELVSPKLFQWVTAGNFFTDTASNSFLTTRTDLDKLGSTYKLSAVTNKTPSQTQNLKLDGRINKAIPGESDIAIMPLTTAQKTLRMHGELTSYVVSVSDQDQLPVIKDRLASVLGEKYEVAAWWDLFPFIDDLQKVGRSFFDIVTMVFLIILLVAVANTLLSRVMERRAEIGTMSATGISAHFILLMFTLEGVFLALIGASAGAIVGIVGVVLMHIIGVPFSLPGGEATFVLRPTIFPEQIFKVILWAIAGSLVASIWPALKGARLKPMDALRDVS